MILVDSNAWIQHLRKRDPRLVQFLSQQRVHTSDVVIGELLLGSGLPRELARDLRQLPRLPSPNADETRSFIERHSRVLPASGVGWADAQIILTAAKAGARIYSSDRSVRKVCRALGVSLA